LARSIYRVRIVVKMESKFIDRLSNILKVKKHNSTYLSKLILHLNEAKELKKKKRKFQMIINRF